MRMTRSAVGRIRSQGFSAVVSVSLHFSSKVILKGSVDNVLAFPLVVWEPDSIDPDRVFTYFLGHIIELLSAFQHLLGVCLSERSVSHIWRPPTSETSSSVESGLYLSALCSPTSVLPMTAVVGVVLFIPCWFTPIPIRGSR